jgi:hypothetical protein
MIVMDCSGSLVNGSTPSDYYGYRYEATSMFLDLLSEKGNHVGAILFNGPTSTSDSSEASMRSGLQLNLPPQAMESKEDRAALMKQIRSVQPGGYTDIGTALLEAARHLEGLEAQNGKESIIVLFTDGQTETKDKQKNPDLPDSQLPVYAQSIKNQTAALELIRSEGITLCGVYLNEEDVDPTSNEVLRMVRIANGYSENATEDQVGDRFIHVKKAVSLSDAYQRFFTLVSGTGAKPFEQEKEFRIPGAGIKEVNICISIQEGSIKECKKALENLKVTISRPGLNEYTSREMAEIMHRGSTYVIYKISEPEAGLWNVTVDSKKAKVSSSILFTPTVHPEISYSVAPDDIRIDKPFSVRATLIQDGSALTEEKDYQEYSCTFWVQNAQTLDRWPVELLYHSSEQAYTGELYVQEYGQYYVYSEFTCGDSIRITTPVQYWNIFNHLPTVPEYHTVSISIGLLSKGTAQIDLKSLVHDREDIPEDITVTLDMGQYPESAYSQDGDTLTIDGLIGGSGQITAIFTDTDGGQSKTEILIKVDNHVKRDMYILRGLLIAGIVAIVAILVRKWVKKRLGGNLPGVIRLTLPLSNSIAVPLTVSAQNAVNQTLYDILEDNYKILLENALDRHCTEADVKAFLREESKQLSAISITAVENAKTGKSLCRLVGLSEQQGTPDLSDRDSMLIPLHRSVSSIRIEYSRYQ